MQHKNFITFIFYFIGLLAYGGVENQKTSELSETEQQLQLLASEEQRQLDRLVEMEKAAFIQKKEFARKKMFHLLWLKYGPMNDCVQALYRLIKPISDNLQSGQCLGGQERLSHFIRLHDELLDMPINTLLTDPQKNASINKITKDALWASSQYNQALEKSAFDFSSCTPRHDESKEFLKLLQAGDSYTAHGTNFTCGALLNFGFGGGCGTRTTPLGETNCVLMQESNLSVGCPQLACTSISSHSPSGTFLVNLDDQDLENVHLAFAGIGSTSAKKGTNTFFECLLSPFSALKAGAVKLLNITTPKPNFAKFQSNLGFTLDMCAQNLPEYYEQQLERAHSPQEIDALVEQFKANH